METQVLILLVHGSRAAESLEELRQLVGNLRRASRQYPRIEFAFLTLQRPTLGEVLDIASSDGNSRFSILPYFLLSGNHVLHDIPELVACEQLRLPHLVLELLPHIGKHPGLLDLIGNVANN